MTRSKEKPPACLLTLGRGLGVGGEPPPATHSPGVSVSCPTSCAGATERRFSHWGGSHVGHSPETPAKRGGSADQLGKSHKKADGSGTGPLQFYPSYHCWTRQCAKGDFELDLAVGRVRAQHYGTLTERRVKDDAMLPRSIRCIVRVAGSVPTLVDTIDDA